MQFRFTNWCLEQRVFLDRNPKRSTCVVPSIFSKKYNSMTLVWKIIEICTQNKMNQRRKNRPLVLNRETKWKIFVLNGVNVWRPRRQTSTQTFLEWPPPPPPFPQVMDLLRLDCEHSLFFFRFNGGRAHARERRAEKRGRQPPARLACSVTRVVTCESRAFCSTDQEKKRDCLWSTLKQDHKINYFKMRKGTQIQQK